jgi:hypothetical protein
VQILWRFLDSIPLPLLTVAAIFMALAPFVPQPHLLEKLKMLAAGRLVRPLDIFDLFFHLVPLLLLLAKVARGIMAGKAG